MNKSVLENKEYYFDKNVGLYLSDEEIALQILINGAIRINTGVLVICCPDILYRNSNLFKRVEFPDKTATAAGLAQDLFKTDIAMKYYISPVVNLNIICDNGRQCRFAYDEVFAISPSGMTYMIRTMNNAIHKR